MAWELLFNSKKEVENSLITNKVGRRVIDGVPICLVNNGHNVYAFKDECPHALKPMFGGNCEGEYVTCPIHKFRFNLKTGLGHGLSLQLYLIKIEKGKYFISV